MIVWRRNLGGRRVAHAYADGKGLCFWAKPFDSPLAVPTALAPSGMPYGRVCDSCEGIVHAKRWGSAIMKAWLTFVLAIGSVSCARADSERADWYGDTSFTADERERIASGARWLREQACLGPPRIAWTLDVGEQPLPKTIRRGRPAGDANDSGLCRGGTIWLDPAGSPATAFPGLAAHELAHCELGFVDGYHADEQQTDGIMRVLDPMRWTDAERAQCASSPTCRCGK